MHKQITTILREGATVVTLDNAEGTVKSAQLARAITALVWSDRSLDEDTPSWNAFLVEWLKTLGDEAFTVAELTKRLR